MRVASVMYFNSTCSLKHTALRIVTSLNLLTWVENAASQAKNHFIPLEGIVERNIHGPRARRKGSSRDPLNNRWLKCDFCPFQQRNIWIFVPVMTLHEGIQSSCPFQERKWAFCSLVLLPSRTLLTITTRKVNFLVPPMKDMVLPIAAGTSFNPPDEFTCPLKQQK